LPASIAAGHTDVVAQAPQASLQAAPLAAKAAAAVTSVYAACFGLPEIPVAVYLLRVGRLPWLFDLFSMYSGPWYDSGLAGRSAAQLGAVLVVMLVVSWGARLAQHPGHCGAVAIETTGAGDRGNLQDTVPLLARCLVAT
jgi:hypothetical protein